MYTPEEEELIALVYRAQMGDGQAWEELVERYKEPLWFFLCSLTNPEAAHRDL